MKQITHEFECNIEKHEKDWKSAFARWKSVFPCENAFFPVETPLFFEVHKPLPWKNQSNLSTGNGSLDKPHSNSLALSNRTMILNSESATKFCQINCVAVSMFYILFLWGWRVRVKSRIPRNDFFFPWNDLNFLKQPFFCIFTKRPKKADHEDVGITPLNSVVFLVEPNPAWPSTFFFPSPKPPQKAKSQTKGPSPNIFP